MSMNDPDGHTYEPASQFTMQTKAAVTTPLQLDQILAVIAQQAAGRIPVQVITTHGVQEIRNGDDVTLQMTGHDSITITFLPPLGKVNEQPQRIDLCPQPIAG